MRKIISFITALFFLVALAAMPFVSAAPTFDVKVKGIPQSEEPVSVIAGENVPIRMAVRVMEDIEDVYARAEFDYKNGKVTTLSSAFDLLENSTYVLDGEKGLYLGIPQDIQLPDEGGDLFIHVQLEDDDGDVIDSEGIELQADFRVILQRETNKITIQNATMPEVFKAGEKTLVTATIKNLGTNMQSNLYGHLIVSRLGILSKEDIGSLSEAGDDNDEAAFDMPLILPDYTESGTYTLELKVFNDDVVTRYIRTINVDGVRTGLKFTEVLPRDVIMNVEQDGRAVYRVSILNLGTETQTYDIKLADDVKDWGTVQIDPERITLEENEKKVVEIYVSPNKETLGEKVFTTTVSSDNDVIEELKLVADVKESELKLSTMNPFLISLIVAAILLVVIIVGMFGLRLHGEYKSRIKAVKQVYEAKDIGREQAKEEVTGLMHDMMSMLMGAKEHEKEEIMKKTAERAAYILHPLNENEMNDVVTEVVSRLEKKEGLEEDEEAGHKINVRAQTRNFLDEIIDKLEGREDVDDVIHGVAQKLNIEDPEKSISALESLRERLGEEIEKIKAEEEEEVVKGVHGADALLKGSRKARKARKKKAVKKKAGKKAKAKNRKPAKRKVKRVKGRAAAKKKKSAKKKKTRKAKKEKRKRIIRKRIKRTIKKTETITKPAKPAEKAEKKEKPTLAEKIITTRTIEKY